MRFYYRRKEEDGYERGQSIKEWPHRANMSTAQQ
jgi:hypothetical protein